MVQKEVTAQVPVLSILSLPSLAIDEVTLDFELKLVAHDTGSTAAVAAPAAAPTGKAGKVVSHLAATSVRAAKLFAVPARANLVRGAEGKTTLDTTGSIKIRVVARRQDTLGLQKVQSLLDGATGEKVT
jgi:hypothetical protein